MESLDWRYAGREHDVIQLNASLEQGWRYLGKAEKKNNYWGFDESIRAEYHGDSYFRCRLYVVALGSPSLVSVQSFPSVEFSGALGRNTVVIHGFAIVIDVPLGQGWSRSKQGRPLIYQISERLFQAKTLDGPIDFRAQLWVVYHGEEKMFVKHEYEWGDGFAWIGGRPESNRRKF